MLTYLHRSLIFTIGVYFLCKLADLSFQHPHELAWFDIGISDYYVQVFALAHHLRVDIAFYMVSQFLIPRSGHGLQLKSTSSLQSSMERLLLGASLPAM